MSGQWEVVGKKKEKQGNNKQVGKNGPIEAKKMIKPDQFKLEDVLAKSQMKTIFSSNDKPRDTKNEKNKHQDSEKKASNNVAKKKDKIEVPPKPKAPTSISSALKQISAEEFNSLFEKSKQQFPDAPIVWLRELVHHLNQKIPIEVHDVVFSTKSLSYPLILVPNEIYAIIEKAVRAAKPSNAQLFFDICLSAMATDMSKNLPSLGYKIFLQFIAREHPALVVANLEKHIVLRNSYQNRSNIGLSILWAVGQTGYKDFQSAVAVFEVLMLPLIEQKNYSRYVVQYLINILNNTKNDVCLTKEQHLNILETIYANKKNFPTDLKQDLIDSLPQIKTLMFNNYLPSDNLNSLNAFYMKNLLLYNDTHYQNSVCDVLIDSFRLGKVNIEEFTLIYEKNVAATEVLLKYIEKNWSKVNKEVRNKSISFISTAIISRNVDWTLKRKKVDRIDEIDQLVRNISIKMVASNSSSSFSIVKLLIICAIAVCTVYIFTKPENRDKFTLQTFRQSVVYQHLQSGIDYTNKGVKWTSDQIEVYLPGLQTSAKEIIDPYIELSKNLGITFYNAGERFLENESVEPIVTGIVKHTKSTVHNVATSTQNIINRTLLYLENEFFVGELSPENMQRFVIEAFNNTQTKATEYYQWIYEKVQTAIK